MKATTEEIITAYQETGSVWKAAKRLGIVGQSVWERLRGVGYPIPGRRWTTEELHELQQMLPNMTLTEIALQLGRPYAGVALIASRKGWVTRVGNRMKRKVPRGSGLTKLVVKRLLADLQNWDGSIRQFCRGRGLSIDVFALAVQRDEPELWRQIAWQRGLPEQICPNCETAFYPMTSKQIGCTRRCTAAYRRDQAYFGGKRKHAIGLAESRCQLCQRSTTKLQAHHVLGKENDDENEVLIALCAGCHKLVTLAASRRFVDDEGGWERLIELTLARRLADKKGQFVGTHVCVDMEYLTEDDVTELDESGVSVDCRPRGFAIGDNASRFARHGHELKRAGESEGPHAWTSDEAREAGRVGGVQSGVVRRLKAITPADANERHMPDLSEVDP